MASKKRSRRRTRSTRASGSEARPRHEPLRRPLQGRGKDRSTGLDGRGVALPFVVVAELRAGFALGKRSAENERVLRLLLLKPGVRVVYADEQTTHHYASVFRQLRKQGTAIPTNDIWIAALVLQHDLVLHDRDKHFDALAQIVRV